MNKSVLIILMILSFAASALMYYLGNESGRMDELLDFWYYPIPLGVLCLVGLFKQKKTPAK